MFISQKTPYEFLTMRKPHTNPATASHFPVKYLHGITLRKTNMIPLRKAQLFTLGLPPLGGFIREIFVLKQYPKTVPNQFPSNRE